MNEMNPRTAELMKEILNKVYVRTDHMFAGLMIAQWIFGICCAVFLSPYAWNGSISSVHPHIWVALLMGGLLTFVSMMFAYMHPGKAYTRHVLAVCQMLMSSLLIHLTGGRIETHFHVFGSLAFLAFYCDWKVLMTGATVVALDHILRGSFFSQSVFGIANVSHWRWVEHAAWVAFENAFLIASCLRSQEGMRQVCERQTAVESLHKKLEQTVQERTQELNVTQKQLLESQKLEAIGQLASGVAHDFNNMLGGILAYSSMLKEDYAHDPVLVNGLQTIETSAERGAEMTKKLLAFARKGNYEFTRVDLKETVQEAVSLLEPSLMGKIQVSIDCPQNLWPTEGDSTQIFQVVMNLAVNAKDAMENGGTLKISACNLEADADYIQVHKSVPLGEYVRLSVVDSGSGISREIQEKIFEPFFTTKQPGSGTGLGLSMVYGIMKNHKGAVSLYSEEGHGTVFHLYFPRSTMSERTPSRTYRDERLHKRFLASQKILLVDDEESMRNVGRDILSRYGANVTLCENGAEAVQLIQDPTQQFDIVILDVIMPKMNGIEAFHRLRENLPYARYIFSSGYAESIEITNLRNEYAVQFIQKPFKGEQLAREVMMKKGA
jgi:signal transduction histidine kinase